MKIGRNQPCLCGSGKKYKKCCLNKKEDRSPFSEDEAEIELLLDAGYSFLKEKELEKACDTWLKLWERLKVSFRPEMRNFRDLICMCRAGDFIYDWCQDLDMELHNAGLKNLAYHHKRITYCQEFCDFFPDSEELIIHNKRRSIAESQFAIGEVAEAKQTFKELITEYPDNIWGYIGWGDLYVMPPGRNAPQDREKAEQIYQRAVGLGLDDEDILLERIEKVRKEGKAAS